MTLILRLSKMISGDKEIQSCASRLFLKQCSLYRRVLANFLPEANFRHAVLFQNALKSSSVKRERLQMAEKLTITSVLRHS